MPRLRTLVEEEEGGGGHDDTDDTDGINRFRAQSHDAKLITNVEIRTTKILKIITKKVQFYL